MVEMCAASYMTSTKVGDVRVVQRDSSDSKLHVHTPHAQLMLGGRGYHCRGNTVAMPPQFWLTVPTPGDSTIQTTAEGIKKVGQ